jgi:ketosteroid isomerase-like protein
MSAENVELVRRSLEALTRGDVEGFLAKYAAHGEWTTAVDEPDPQTYRGAEGLRRFVDEAAEPWLDRFDGVTEFGAFTDCGDWVVVPWIARVHGRGSHVPIEISEVYAARVEDGRIAAVREFRTEAEALAAVRR